MCGLAAGLAGRPIPEVLTMASALICGSLAYDTIMVFQDQFKNHILPDKVHILNVSFLVPRMRREFGGCAGNIAYNLKLLGGDPVPMATVGQDFGPYREHFEACEIRLDHVKEIEDLYTAQAFITTDLDDNQITARLHANTAFGNTRREIPGLILEGGSIESDGAGTLLTTSTCLLEANRNPHLSRTELEEQLCQQLGVTRILWLEHGYLAGDDTDSHVDTLARLAPNQTIIYQSCDDPQDEHFTELQAMAKELAALRTAEGTAYRLIPLPWPAPCYDSEGQRLPATYANYLILNTAVLVPIYGNAQDQAACAAIATAFPEREIVPILCRELIEQHGSLHCVTMQIPQGVLS